MNRNEFLSKVEDGKAFKFDPAMILTDTVKADNEKMEQVTSAKDEQIKLDEQQSSYPKRSSVVGMWRKREEAIRASKDKTREVDFEEKKEGEHEVDHDSRQQDKSNNITPPLNSKLIGSERNAPDNDSNSNENVKYGKKFNDAPRRSNIRESWKKKSPNGHAFQLQRTMDISTTTSDSMASAQSKSSLRGDIVSGTTNTRITESLSNTSSNAFDELKSKWAKFGIEKEEDPTAGRDPNQMVETEGKEKDKHASVYEPVQPYSQMSEDVAEDETKARESLTKSSNITGDSSLDKGTQDASTKDTKVSQSSHASRGLAARRMGSKRFRSKFGRRPNPTSSSSTEEISSPTKNASDDLIRSGKTISNPSSFTRQSPGQFVPSIKKDLVPSFPIDEIGHDESDFYSTVSAEKKTAQADNNHYRSFVPLNPDAPMSKTTDSVQSLGSKSKDVSMQSKKAVWPPGSISKVATNESSPWRDDGSNIQEDSSEVHSYVSKSSLSSRANRRLRDIRKRNQARKEDDDENPKSSTELSSSIRRIEKKETFMTRSMPMDESAAFGQSQFSESANANSHLHSAYTNENATENTTSTDSKGGHRLPLHGVVPDVAEIVPDAFVSEKNANVESFKMAYDKTSFGQIASDMKEEASSLFDVNAINEGIDSAIDTFGLRDIFQTKSPQKTARRAPSPVEEVAIEVEYVADSD